MHWGGPETMNDYLYTHFCLGLQSSIEFCLISFNIMTDQKNNYFSGTVPIWSNPIRLQMNLIVTNYIAMTAVHLYKITG